MFTPFGKKIRKMRIDKEVRLKDMALSLGVTSAFLSAIETGKKNITPKLFDDTVQYFNLNKIASVRIRSVWLFHQPLQ